MWLKTIVIPGGTTRPPDKPPGKGKDKEKEKEKGKGKKPGKGMNKKYKYPNGNELVY